MEQIDKLILEKRQEKEIATSELNKLIKVKQDNCPHPQVVLSGGGMWHEWPDYGWFRYDATCLECGLFVEDNDPRYNKMKQNCVKDERTNKVLY